MPEVREGGVNVTPLIDVVMVMIIFFMLVAKIGVATGAEEQIDIPVSTLGKDIKDVGIESALVLNVREIGNLPMVTANVEADATASRSGRPVELKIYDPTTKRRPLTEVLRKLRHGDPRSGLAANPEFKVIIRGDRSITYRTLDPTTKRRPLTEVLRKLRHGDPRSGLAANPEFKVIIRGDRSITYRTLDPVLLACMEANVKNVNLNTAKP